MAKKNVQAADTTNTTTLGKLKVGDFFIYEGKLCVKTQAFWDNNPGMDYGIIQFTEKRGKVIKQGMWQGSKAEVSLAVFMDDAIATALVILENGED